MRTLAIFLFTGLALHMELPAEGVAHFKSLFWKQVASSCQGNLAWEKSVSDISEGAAAVPQRIAFQVECGTGRVVSDGIPANLPWGEFSYLFDSDIDNPYLSPMLDVQRGPAGISAQPKPDEADDCPLKLLKFEMVDGVLRKAEVKVHKTNTLYEMMVHMVVLFNVDGTYASHETRTFSDVLLGGDVQTLIQGVDLAVTKLLIVFLGGGFGSLARYGLARWLNPENGALPLGTLLANVAACVVVGFVMGWVVMRGPMQEGTRLILVTGFCGGFSTFSTFSGESLALFQAGKPMLAVLYVAGSVLACLGAAWLGYWLGRQ